MELKTSEKITVNPQIMGGKPVFAGTRVAIQSFFDYLETGESIHTFLQDFPTVERHDLLEFIAYTRNLVEKDIKESL